MRGPWTELRVTLDAEILTALRQLVQRHIEALGEQPPQLVLSRFQRRQRLLQQGD